MCGIAGVASLTAAPVRHVDHAPRMRETLVHRGPDGSGSADHPGASLQIRRLAIIDLQKGDQPFTSPDGRVSIVCNGEIYNSADLREDRAAAAYPFRSRSDVESVLPLYLAYGPAFVRRLEGMFALAIWDERNRRLVLARDRAGEKPLFWTEVGGELVFGSEAKALLQYPGVDRALDPVALATCVAMGYVLQPRTMYRTIRKLPPGHLLVADERGVRVETYWEAAATGTGDRRTGGERGNGERGWGTGNGEGDTGNGQRATGPTTLADAARQVREAMRRAAGRQLMSDVPLGVFVSGGLDSSLLLALAAGQHRHGPLYTYTVSFGDPSYDESGPAALVARHCGTTHRAVSCDRPNLRRALDVMRERLDEPLGDPAVLPTYLLSEAAADDVKVVLSGEGADELFGGYPTYLGHAAAGRFASLPRTVRAAISRAVFAVPPSPGKVTLEFLLKRFVAAAELEPLRRHVEWFGAVGLTALPNVLGPAARAGADEAAADIMSRGLRSMSGRPVLDGAQLFDTITYLPDDLLTKVDRATMLASIEARAPFLDREVMELALGLPARFKVRGLRTKVVLREAARPLLPPSVLRRRKRGLSVPVAAWINTELKQEVDRLFERGRLAREGWLSPDGVHRLLAEHRAGAANHSRKIWPLVMLQRWLERWC